VELFGDEIRISKQTHRDLIMQWVSTEIEKPPHEGRYLVYEKYRNTMIFKFWKNGEWHDRCLGGIKCRRTVSHWMKDLRSPKEDNSCTN
jgi:hypothetical protein